MPKKLLFFLFAIVFFAVVAIFWPRQKSQAPPIKVSNFEECAAAGFAVMESYPPQCRTPNGEVYFKIMSEY